MHHRIYKRELISPIIESLALEGPAKRGQKRTSTEVLTRLSGRHFLRKIAPTGAKKNISRACEVCTPAAKAEYRAQGLPIPKRAGKESSYECEQCEVTLCVVPCNKIYHTCQDYVAAFKRAKEENDN